jgi:hypothetical protein
MTETAPAICPRVLNVGPDRVTISETEAVIEARHPMLDWDVREMNPVPVYLEDKKYVLIEKRKAEAPYAVRYLLHPWPMYHQTNADIFHAYGPDIVAERDACVRTGNLEDLGRAFLMPFYPVLGLLWSGAQNRLVRFGYVPRSITGFSIFTVFSLLFGQAVFALILLNSALRTGKIVIGGFLRAVATSDHIALGPVNISITFLDVLLAVALCVDVIGRYSLYLRDDQWSGGFLEWIFSRRKRPAAISALDSSVD